MTSPAEEDGLISFGRRLSDLARLHPETTAIVLVTEAGDERTISWGDLDERSNRFARLLARRGVDERAVVAVALPNSIEHYVATFAGWKLGAMVLPLRWALPQRERDLVLATAEPTVVVTDWTGGDWPLVSLDDLAASADYSAEPLADRVPQPGFAIGSGGSTGRPKIIVNPAPMVGIPFGVGAADSRMGMRHGQVQLVPGPLYHTLGFSWGHWGLFEDHLLIVMQRWDAGRVLDLIERYRINFMALVPSMMQRIVKVPGWRARDFSSLQAVYHSGGMCPPWLKRDWIDLIGGEKVHEAFGSTESHGHTYIRGDDWLTHPGSVGRPEQTELRVLDAEGRDLPAGEVGEIYMRPNDGSVPCYYLGAPPVRSTSDGFASVGDLGWLDADGYLYPADRRVDMIISGGANVFPAEVEAALADHPEVLDLAVIGVPDEDWGRRVHVIIQPRDAANAPDIAGLDRHARERIAAYKIPKSYEFIVALPRDDSGKIRRSALADEREAGWSAGMLRPPQPVPHT